MKHLREKDTFSVFSVLQGSAEALILSRPDRTRSSAAAQEDPRWCQCWCLSYKSVPRQLTCFVGRLDDSTTEEELHEYVTSVGMKGVVCKRLVPKNGRVFKTAAFRVSCCLESKDLFYNDLNWPSGAELRDWVFYTGNRNG